MKGEEEKYLKAIQMTLEADINTDVNKLQREIMIVKEEIINECDEEYNFIQENTTNNTLKLNIKEEIITEEDILAEGGFTAECFTEEGVTEECIMKESFAGEGFIGAGCIEGFIGEDSTEGFIGEGITEGFVVEGIIEQDGIEDNGTEDDSTDEESTEYDSTDDDSTEEDSIEKSSTVEHLYKATAITDPQQSMTGDVYTRVIKEECISDEEISDNLKNNYEYNYESNSETVFEYNNESNNETVFEYNNQSNSETVFENCKLAKMDKISDCKLQSFNDSTSKQIESKKSKRIGMMNKREIKKTAKVIQAQRRYTELKKQSILLQAEEPQQLKFNEARKQRIEEIESKKHKSKELKTEHKTKLNKLVELQNVKTELRKSEEAALKKAKEIELRKNIEKGKEPKIILQKVDIGLEKRSLKIMKELPGYNQSVGHAEIDKVKSYNVSPAHCKKNNEHIQNDRNIEQVLNESRKPKENVDLETFNPRDRDIRKSIGSERKTSKGVETKSAEVKIITRTRRLKVDKNLKEQNVSTKLRPQIKFSGSSTSSASSTLVGNSPIASYESKKQTKSTDDGNKRNSCSSTLNNNKRNLGDQPSVNVTKENLNHEASNAPTTRTRTRSASFKQKTNLETKSSKKIQGYSAAVVPKGMAATKTNKSLMPLNNIFDKHPEFNDHNQLLVPVVMLHKVHQGTLNFMKHHELKLTNQHQEHKPIETPPPKKRGRKRRIDVLNEKLQESSSNKPPTLRNEKTMNTSIIEVEPLAKRTRRSLELRERKKQSVNKESVQPRKNKKDCMPKKSVQPQKNKKKLLNKSRPIKINKNFMKYVCNRLCERNKYLLTTEKRVKNITSEQYPIIKTQVELKDIMKKIAKGQLTEFNQLQVDLLTLPSNALMINKNSDLVFSDNRNFLSHFIKDCEAFQNSMSDNNDRNSQHKYCPVNCISNFNIGNSDVSEYAYDIIINKKSLANLHKTRRNSSKETYGKPQPKNKRKKTTSGSSHSGSDNC